MSVAKLSGTDFSTASERPNLNAPVPEDFDPTGIGNDGKNLYRNWRWKYWRYPKYHSDGSKKYTVPTNGSHGEAAYGVKHYLIFGNTREEVANRVNSFITKIENLNKAALRAAADTYYAIRHDTTKTPYIDFETKNLQRVLIGSNNSVVFPGYLGINKDMMYDI